MLCMQIAIVITIDEKSNVEWILLHCINFVCRYDPEVNDEELEESVFAQRQVNTMLFLISVNA